MWNRVENGDTEGIDGSFVEEIRDTPADRWISDWPTYMGKINCQQSDAGIICENGLEITTNLSVNTDKIRYISFINASEEFERIELNPAGEFSILISSKGVYATDNRLSASVFTKLYFFEGNGLDYFESFTHKQSITGSEIYVYKVNLGDKDE